MSPPSVVAPRSIGAALCIVVVVVAGARSPAAAQSSSEPVYRPPVDVARARSVPCPRHAVRPGSPRHRVRHRTRHAGRRGDARDGRVRGRGRRRPVGDDPPSRRCPHDLRTACDHRRRRRPIRHDGRCRRHDGGPAAAHRPGRRQLLRSGAAVRRRRRRSISCRNWRRCRRFRSSSFGLGDLLSPDAPRRRTVVDA